MKPSYILSINTPCQESWNEMMPADKGGFCQHCQKTVTDFSALSDPQLIELLKNKKASACGRFTIDQLNRVISASVPEKRRKPFISIATIVAALAIATPAVKAASLIEKSEQIADKDHQANNVSLENPTGIISGIVRLSGDNLPAQYVTVRIKDRNIGTQTDRDGRFKLRVPDDFRKKVLILEVSLIGYAKKRVKVVLRKEIKPLDIILEEDTIIFGEYIITNDKQEVSLWKKFRGTVSSIFS